MSCLHLIFITLTILCIDCASAVNTAGYKPDDMNNEDVQQTLFYRNKVAHAWSYIAIIRAQLHRFEYWDFFDSPNSKKLAELFKKEIVSIYTPLLDKLKEVETKYMTLSIPFTNNRNSSAFKNAISEVAELEKAVYGIEKQTEAFKHPFLIDHQHKKLVLANSVETGRFFGQFQNNYKELEDLYIGTMHLVVHASKVLGDQDEKEFLLKLVHLNEDRWELLSLVEQMRPNKDKLRVTRRMYLKFQAQLVNLRNKFKALGKTLQVGGWNSAQWSTFDFMVLDLNVMSMQLPGLLFKLNETIVRLAEDFRKIKSNFQRSQVAEMEKNLEIAQMNLTSINKTDQEIIKKKAKTKKYTHEDTEKLKAFLVEIKTLRDRMLDLEEDMDDFDKDIKTLQWKEKNSEFGGFLSNSDYEQYDEETSLDTSLYEEFHLGDMKTNMTSFVSTKKGKIIVSVSVTCAVLVLGGGCFFCFKRQGDESDEDGSTDDENNKSDKKKSKTNATTIRGRSSQYLSHSNSNRRRRNHQRKKSNNDSDSDSYLLSQYLSYSNSNRRRRNHRRKKSNNDSDNDSDSYLLKRKSRKHKESHRHKKNDLDIQSQESIRKVSKYLQDENNWLDANRVVSSTTTVTTKELLIDPAMLDLSEIYSQITQSPHSNNYDISNLQDVVENSVHPTQKYSQQSKRSSVRESNLLITKPEIQGNVELPQMTSRISQKRVSKNEALNSKQSLNMQYSKHSQHSLKKQSKRSMISSQEVADKRSKGRLSSQSNRQKQRNGDVSQHQSQHSQRLLDQQIFTIPEGQGQNESRHSTNQVIQGQNESRHSANQVIQGQNESRHSTNQVIQGQKESRHSSYHMEPRQSFHKDSFGLLSNKAPIQTSENQVFHRQSLPNKIGSKYSQRPVQVFDDHISADLEGISPLNEDHPVPANSRILTDYEPSPKVSLGLEEPKYNSDSGFSGKMNSQVLTNQSGVPQHLLQQSSPHLTQAASSALDQHKYSDYTDINSDLLYHSGGDIDSEQTLLSQVPIQADFQSASDYGAGSQQPILPQRVASPHVSATLSEQLEKQGLSQLHVTGSNRMPTIDEVVQQPLPSERIHSMQVSPKISQQLDERIYSNQTQRVLSNNRTDVSQRVASHLSPTSQHVSQRVASHLSPTSQHVSHGVASHLSPTSQHVSQRVASHLSPTSQHVSQGVISHLSPTSQHVSHGVASHLSPTSQHVSQGVISHLSPTSQHYDSQGVISHLSPTSQHVSQGVISHLSPTSQHYDSQGVISHLSPTSQHVSQGVISHLSPTSQHYDSQGVISQLSPTSQHVSQGVISHLSPTSQHVSHGVDSHLSPTSQHVSHGVASHLSPTSQHVSQRVDSHLSPTSQHVSQGVISQLSPTSQHVSQTDNSQLSPKRSQRVASHLSPNLSQALQNNFHSVFSGRADSNQQIVNNGQRIPSQFSQNNLSNHSLEEDKQLSHDQLSEQVYIEPYPSHHVQRSAELNVSHHVENQQYGPSDQLPSLVNNSNNSNYARYCPVEGKVHQSERSAEDMQLNRQINDLMDDLEELDPSLYSFSGKD